MAHIWNKISFNQVMGALEIKGWNIKTAPETEEYFLANFKIINSSETNAAGENVHIYSTNPDHFGVTWSDITTKLAELETEYDAQEYARNRQREYPKIEELVVALYDTDDKVAIEAKRAEVKAKYPK